MRFLASVFSFVFLVSAATFAQSDDHTASVDQVMQKIYDNLGLKSGDRVNPDQVPPALLEELGDAVMSEIHPDGDVHEWMDQMMGGEGSDSLAAAHRWMGYRYLSGGYGPGMMGSATGGMMGRGMMGNGFNGWGMMGNPNIAPGNYPYRSPEQIVKDRYAKGEITREQYLQMMKDLAEPEEN